jgi:hypothetical protein
MRPLLLKCIVQPLENLGVLHITLLGKLQEQIRIWPSVATVKTSTFEKCVITGAINYVKS